MPHYQEPIYEKAYGYVQVRIGAEEKVARLINSLFSDIQAYAIKQIKHRSRMGVRSYASSLMVPGYVIFRTQRNYQITKLQTISSIMRILTYSDNSWQLRGEDFCCAKWVYDHHGVVGVSIAYIENDIIRISDGPLKEVEERIVRIDKRNQNALVTLGLHQEKCKIWLAFNWMDSLHTRRINA